MNTPGRRLIARGDSEEAVARWRAAILNAAFVLLSEQQRGAAAGPPGHRSSISSTSSADGDPAGPADAAAAVPAPSGSPALVLPYSWEGSKMVVEMAGMLTKRGQIRKSWQRRFFSLIRVGDSSYLLQYAESAAANEPIGTLLLRGANVVPCYAYDRPHCFDVITRERTMTMCAPRDGAGPARLPRLTPPLPCPATAHHTTQPGRQRGDLGGLGQRDPRRVRESGGRLQARLGHGRRR